MSFSAFAKENAEIYKNIGGGGEVIKITATGTATATSPLSYEDALEIAKKDAYQVALSSANNDGNVINQTVTIINQNSRESVTTNSLTSNVITTDSVTANSITTDSITSDNIVSNSLQMNGNITLPTLFTTPILGQLGYINNISTFTAKSLVSQNSVILSQITITPGVWQVFYKFKYYNTAGGFVGGIYSYIYGLTTSNTLCTSSNYQGFLSNQYAYSAGEDGFYIGPIPTFESNKESLAVNVTQNTTYYLQFGLDSPAATNLNAIATSLYAVRIA